MAFSTEVWLWGGAVVAFFMFVVGLQWFFTRERWRNRSEAQAGEGAYRSHTIRSIGAPRFPKRIALLATLTNLWGLATLVFAAAGFLLVGITTSHAASTTLIGLASCSGVVLGIASFVVASRVIGRSDRAVVSAQRYAAFGLVHHLAVIAAFAVGTGDVQELLPAVLLPCAIGIGLAAWMYFAVTPSGERAGPGRAGAS